MRTTLALCPVVVLAAFAIAALARGDDPTRNARSSTPTAPPQVALVAPEAAALPSETAVEAVRPTAEATESAEAAPRRFYDDLPAFDDSPQGAFGRMRLAILAKDGAILRDATTITDEKAVQEVLGTEPLLSAELTSVEVAGDQAKLEVSCLGRQGVPMGAVRVGGRWKIDPTRFRSETRCRECANNLRQLGVYLVMWYSKYGEDKRYPGPGAKLLLDLFSNPAPETAIGRGCEELVHCGAAGGTFNAERVTAGDPAAMDYECTSLQVADSVTDPRAPIAWDRTPCHDGKRNVLFFAGHVTTVTEDEFLQLIGTYGR